MGKIGVLVADDHAIVRQGLRYFLNMQPDLEVVGEAANGQEAVQKAIELRPDIVLMDLIMPVMNGIEAARAIRREAPEVKVIVLTTFSEKDHVLSAIQAGAAGYLLKDTEPGNIAEAIRGVFAGHPHLDSAATEQLMSHVAAEPKTLPAMRERLTEREKEVLRYLAEGLSNKEIAAVCGIADKTVKTHVSHLLGKLGLSDRTQAAVYAVRNGLDDP